MLEGWRRRILPRLPHHARMAMSLTPPVGWSPTFFIPARAGAAPELLDQIRSVAPAVIQAELTALAEKQPVPAWAHHLAEDGELRGRFYDGIEHLYAQLLEPYWHRLSGYLTADRALRMRHLLEGGIERLLTLASPRWMRWKPPVLEVRMINGIDHDLHLEGRGILLAPSAFATRSMVTDGAHPMVSYPSGDDLPLHRLTALIPEHETPESASTVAALLGTTRAAVLNAIAEHPGCTTTELARLSGTTPSGASQHATVLRQAGLIQTTRYRNTALHSATSLGITLLDNATGDPASLPRDDHAGR
ncbi:ArsR/SmtB family transcription factor [Microbispora bryophytorum]|uniref:ArsR/SmtB family transcription factor n=1 Tax=Microbispora bryophytorum TaxID=1460882 RepID=UPI0033DC5A60